MKKRFHGLLGFILAVIMTLSMFPSTAFAVDGNADGNVHRHFGY